MNDSPWGEWLLNGAVWSAVGTAVGWITRLLWQRHVHSEGVAEKKQAREERLVDHANSLAIELLKIAKSEAASLRQQISDLQRGDATLAARAQHFEEALQHVEALLNPSGGDREAVEHSARLFLGRMVVFRQIKGTVANLEQAHRATPEQIERAIRKLPGGSDEA